jgi:hypothetical protein
MSNPSNLYAEKIYSEHPLVLWALDDTADYVSLITEAQRDIENQWDVSGGTATEYMQNGAPFLQSKTTRLLGSLPGIGDTNDIICISPDLVNFSDLNSDLGTFCVGTYFYSSSAYLNSISIGYEYTDTTTSLVVQNLKTYQTDVFENWAFISQTFEIPNEFTNLRLVIKINTESGGLSSSDYQFYINGISLGQWSEEFNTRSLGVVPENFPSNIALTTSDKVVPAAAYGISENEGYYIVKGGALLARNTSVPLVYGASGVTKITPNVFESPSLIVPGKGFLNESGRHKDYTIEFWARVNSNSDTPKRIFGPISGNNGLYVEGGFLTLVIGNSFASHFVGEWVRPMLIHIRLIRNSATLLINGEEVASLSFDTNSIYLPNELLNGDSQDWLGFYGHSDVESIEVDCIAIYSYQVPISVAKRRWVYGQGVLSPEGINSAYGGTSSFIDYPFSKYSSNYNYPDFAQWQQGDFDNLITTSTSLTTPEYRLPEIFLDSKTLNEFYLDNQDIQDVASGTVVPNKFITFRPNSGWNSEQCYINFPRFNMLSDQVKVIYGVFSTEDIGPESGPTIQPQTLIKIYNTLTGDYFIIKQEEDIIKYVLNYNGEDEELYTTAPLESGQLFSVGINLDSLINNFGENVSAFFGNQNGLKTYVGGDEDPLNTFTGKLYSFGLSTVFNASGISDYFLSSGLAIFDDLSISGVLEEENAIALLDHIASYTLLPTEAYDKFFLDIGVSGYWQDYIPLSYFAKYVNNSVGSQYYDLDFLQFNIGYPATEKVKENEVVLESWTYEDLKNEYKNPVQHTYSQLDNILHTGWANYEDMSQKSDKFYEYDTSLASIRSYLTFQYIDQGANALSSSFTINEKPKKDKIIDIDSHPSWENTRFEVVDNTIIYPTKTIDFNNLAIVFNLDFKVRNILTKPIRLKRLEFASQVLNNNSFNPVGTRFGVDIFPYKKSGLYYDYKSKNPFSIYKGSTPYLYLNKKTGIEVRGEFSERVERGIAIPINKELASNYRVSATQLWMRYNEDQFPIVPVSLFEVDYKADTIKFYLVADSEKGSRARIYAKSKNTGQIFNGLAYYWNGTLVREPVMTVKEWGVLGISFATALNFDAYLGGINLTGPVLFNNIAYYQANNLQQVQSTINRPWLRVKTDDALNFNWQYWINNFTWQEVLVVDSSDLYGVDPQDVYKTYLGTNKIIIDDSEGVIFDAEKLKIYTNTTWQTTVKIPV